MSSELSKLQKEWGEKFSDAEGVMDKAKNLTETLKELKDIGPDFLAELTSISSNVKQSVPLDRLAAIASTDNVKLSATDEGALKASFKTDEHGIETLTVDDVRHIINTLMTLLY